MRFPNKNIQRATQLDMQLYTNAIIRQLLITNGLKVLRENIDEFLAILKLYYSKVSSSNDLYIARENKIHTSQPNSGLTVLYCQQCHQNTEYQISKHMVSYIPAQLHIWLVFMYFKSIAIAYNYVCSYVIGFGFTDVG